MYHAVSFATVACYVFFMKSRVAAQALHVCVCEGEEVPKQNLNSKYSEEIFYCDQRLYMHFSCRCV